MKSLKSLVCNQKLTRIPVMAIPSLHQAGI